MRWAGTARIGCLVVVRSLVASGGFAAVSIGHRTPWRPRQCEGGVVCESHQRLGHDGRPRRRGALLLPRGGTLLWRSFTSPGRTDAPEVGLPCITDFGAAVKCSARDQRSLSLCRQSRNLLREPAADCCHPNVRCGALRTIATVDRAGRVLSDVLPPIHENHRLPQPAVPH